jgi:enoyl-CoA hydratase/carnithine racemase
MSAEEGLAWGYFNDLVAPERVLARAQEMARSLADGPSFAHAMTKKCLHQEWSQTIEQALETEAEAQAICMQTGDFRRAYEAFVKKEKAPLRGQLRCPTRRSSTGRSSRRAIARWPSSSTNSPRRS